MFTTTKVDSIKTVRTIRLSYSQYRFWFRVLKIKSSGYNCISINKREKMYKLNTEMT